LANSIKDDIIRQRINAWEFDIFGLSETNVDWRLIPEQHKLFFRTKSWWENTHTSHAHNVALPPVSRKQFGGVALFSTGPSVHRIIGKGVDRSLLGRWSWTLYRGKNNHLLKIYSAYRPNPPSGPFSVYAQHRQYFLSKRIVVCPRQAFLDDLSQDMWNSSTLQAFTRLTLREAILDRHGTNAPATYKRNTLNTPMDSCWISPGLEIIRGGYLPFDQLFQDTDHCGIWIDVSFTSAFGYILLPTPKPKARKLNCRDPRIMENFIK
jgi:hypothetical protein